MTELYDATYGQISPLKETFTVSPPDIIGKCDNMRNKWDCWLRFHKAFFQEKAIWKWMVKRIATIQDSVYGNYQITTDEGTYTSMDNVYGGGQLFHFGEAVADQARLIWR